MADDWAGIYDAGTATVAQGSTAVTLQAAGNIRAALKVGDRFGSHVGTPIRIAVIGTNTLTLAYPWPGPTQTASPYEIALTPYESVYRQRLNELLAGVRGEGVRFNVQVSTLAARAAYNGQVAGFAVLVSNIGDGRSAIYSKASNTSGDWSTPAYVTGPPVTLAVTQVEEVPYGTPPEVTATATVGGYNLAFDIPAGMIIEPGTVTTLAPDQQVSVNFVPITGGYRLDIAIPRGPTGDISGVTPFWVTRLGADANASAARQGLQALSYEPQTLTLVQRAQVSKNTGSAMVEVARAVASNSAHISFDLDNENFTNFEVAVIDCIFPAGSRLDLRMGSNGAAGAFADGASDYIMVGATFNMNSSSPTIAVFTRSEIPIASVTSGLPFLAKLTFAATSTASPTLCVSQATFMGPADILANYSQNARRANNAITNAVRLLGSAANITSGTFVLYARPKP